MEGKYLKRFRKTEKMQRKEEFRKSTARKTKKVNAQMTTRQPKCENSSTTNNSAPNSSFSFSCEQTLYSSIARADLHLPKSPNKKTEIVQRHITKTQIKNKLKKKSKKTSSRAK